jgi:isoquinoline 1-oxidoreductase subunit beta
MNYLKTTKHISEASSGARRNFLKLSVAASGGLVIGFWLPMGNKMAQAQDAAAAPPKPAIQPNAFLRISRDGTVTVQVKHLEFGQGVMTSIPMLMAEELDCEWSKVRAELAPAATVYAHTSFGIQMTGGSSSVNDSWTQMRTVGAMARSMLISAAATRWGVDASVCRTDNGSVIGPAGKRMAYGELADAAAKLPAPDTVALKDPKTFKIIGKPTRRVDAPAKVNGSARFGLDVTEKQVPNLHVALVKRPPIFGAKVKSFNADKVNGLNGVTHVVQTANGVAVVAKNFWMAKKGRDALVVEWDMESGSKASTVEMRKHFRELAKTPGNVAKTGNIDALKSAVSAVNAEYEFPFLAHAPMEPLNCTVKISADACEIWAGTQFQTVDQGAAAKVAGLKPTQVKINTMIAGGGFGRRANPASDYIAEAVEIAMLAKVPVKTVWTREDDIQGGYYRPMYVHRVSAGLDASKKIAGWDHTIVGQSILGGTPFEAFAIKNGVDATSVEGVADTAYDLPINATLHSPKTGVTGLWWRSVGHTHTAYVMETMMDDLAKAAGLDPIAFRNAYLTKHPRHLKTLALVAEKANWTTPLATGRARGVAIHESFGSVCAQIAEVSMEKEQIKVHRVVAAIDCGVAVNPLTITAQIEGAIAYGLSAALYGQITLKDGVVEQSNFHNYPILRMTEMPRVEVHILESGDKPTGVGEPGTPPIAPAVSNAIFALTGKRLRTLPFNMDEIKQA